MKRMLIAAILLVGGAAAGCIVHGPGPGHHRVYGPAVVIGAAHVHSDHCGHFHYGGHWYHSHGHRHGPGCGHHFRGGMWIVVD